MVRYKIVFTKRKWKKINKTKIRYLMIWFKKLPNKHKYSINKNKRNNNKAQIKNIEKHQVIVEGNRRR